MQNRRSLNKKRNTASFNTRCRQLLSQIRTIKEEIQRTSAPGIYGYESVLNLALNEAEALAWQTPYPQLFFPVLAEEKAAEIRRWAFRQRGIRRTPAMLAFAA